MAQWISTEQFDWSLARLLDGLAGVAVRSDELVGVERLDDAVRE